MEASEKKKTGLDKAEAVLGSICRVLSYIGTTVMVLAMLLTVVDVLLRYAFRLPVPGSLELMEYFMVIVAFFALGWCELRRKHITVDLITSHIPAKPKLIIACITYILGLAILIPLAWVNALRVGHEYAIQRVSVMLSIPDYPFYGALVLGCVFFILAIALNLVKSVKEATNR